MFTKPKIILNTFARACSTSSNLTLVSESNSVRKIILNNPNKRNALSSSMMTQLKLDLNRNIEDINLRCIVIESKGPVFSSGHDLKELAQSNQKVREDIFKQCSELMMGIKKIPIPVIALVNGLAAAAGCQLVASCDIVIASSKSKFSTPGASVGLFCSTPGIALSRAVPQKIASYMLFTGSNLSAQEAAHYGLVSKIGSEEELDKIAEETIQAILSKSRAVLALGKKFFYEQLEKNIDLAYSRGSEVMVENLGIQEANEGIKAFFEKRTPKWQHI